MKARPKAKRPAHRPSEFDAKAPALLDAIATTPKSIHRLHREDPSKYPAVTTVMRWLDERENFRQQYARAKGLQADLMAGDTIAIADDASRDFAIDPETGAERFDHEHAQRSKLRIDARKWLASKLAPKIYGDRTAHEHSGPDGGAIPSKLTVEYVDPE